MFGTGVWQKENFGKFLSENGTCMTKKRRSKGLKRITIIFGRMFGGEMNCLRIAFNAEFRSSPVGG